MINPRYFILDLKNIHYGELKIKEAKVEIFLLLGSFVLKTCGA
jgi:hypothetical protein